MPARKASSNPLEKQKKENSLKDSRKKNPKEINIKQI
jgi:hypothetical protein